MRRFAPIIVFFLFLFLLPAAAKAGAGDIAVTVRDEFGNALTSGGAEVNYSCGGGTSFTVADGTGSDINAATGGIAIQPVVQASCDTNDTLSVTVKNQSGYLAWQTTASYISAAENTLVSFNKFTVKVETDDEFAQDISSTSAAGIFTKDSTTVIGMAAPSGDAIGYPVPITITDGGSLTVTGFGTQGYVNKTIPDIFVPDTEFDSQRRYFARMQFSVVILAKSELGLSLQGMGGSVIFFSSPSVSCLPESGTNRFGCAVPVGSSAAPVTVSKPGYVTYTIGSVTPPSTASNTQVQTASANMFPVRVLGISSEQGINITPTSSERTPFLSAGGEIREMRYSGGTWLLAVTPGNVQLTAQVPGYANAATGISVGSAGTVTTDFDGTSGTYWSGQVDGPSLQLDMWVTVKDALGSPISGATVGIYASSTYIANHLADDLSVGLIGQADAQKITDSNGQAKFALDTGTYYYRVEKSGLGSVGSASTPAVIGYIETGGPYRVNVTLSASGGTGTVGGQAGTISTTASSVTANPVVLEANNTDAATVTVTILDGVNQPMTNQSVPLPSSRGSSDTITAVSPATNSQGQAVFTIKSGTIGTSTLTASVGATIVSQTVAVSFLEPSAVPVTFAPGALVKLANDGDPTTWSDTTVYYIAKNGKRYFFPNEKTYLSWYGDFSGVRTVNYSTLSAIPFGGMSHYRPGARMIKVQTDARVYAVGRSGTLRWMATEEVARALYGQDWNQAIDDLSDAFFINYLLGSQVAASGDFTPTGEQAGVTTVDQNLGF